MSHIIVHKWSYSFKYLKPSKSTKFKLADHLRRIADMLDRKITIAVEMDSSPQICKEKKLKCLIGGMAIS
jgi:hypothetical protein